MKKFSIVFVGRPVGAIGRFSRFTKVVKAEDGEKAIIKLYDTHEHIRVVNIVEIL